MVTLVILDGFGESKQSFGNAIKSQGTPHLDKLKKLYPHTLLEASGEAVGLPKGIMGGSEVGHLTMGTGRINLQDLKLIDSEIENGNFFKNPSLIKALTHAEKNQSNLHIMGLTSNEGVHGNIDHMFAILDYSSPIDYCKELTKQIYFICMALAFCDGDEKDSSSFRLEMQTAINYVTKLIEERWKQITKSN